jgi:hypothetical protein
MKRPLLSLITALALALTPALAYATFDPLTLSPAAKRDYDASMAAYDRHDMRASVTEYLKVFTAYPDPRAHREMRRQLIGPLHHIWGALYDQTRTREDACAWRSFLATYRQTLEPEIDARQIDWWRKATAEIDASLAHDFPATPTCDGVEIPGARPNASMTTSQAPAPRANPTKEAPAPRVTPTAPPPRPSRGAPQPGRDGTGRGHTGKLFIGVGAVVLLSSAAAGIAYADRYARISSLDRMVDDAGRPPTPDEGEAVRKYEGQGIAAAAYGITTAVLGGALLVAGLAVLLTDRKQPRRRVSVAPHAAPGRWGVQLAASF